MVKIMEIEIVKEFTFDSAHYLPEHPGKCRGIHGHTYRLQVGLKGWVNSDIGMVEDFGNVKEIVDKMVIEKLDHKFLNQLTIPEFPHNRPTAELMVVWIVNWLKPAFTKDYVDKLSFVRLYETPTSYAEWRKEG